MLLSVHEHYYCRCLGVRNVNCSWRLCSLMQWTIHMKNLNASHLSNQPSLYTRKVLALVTKPAKKFCVYDINLSVIEGVSLALFYTWNVLFCRYCDSRRLVLLGHVHEGYDKDLWEYQAHLWSQFADWYQSIDNSRLSDVNIVPCHLHDMVEKISKQKISACRESQLTSAASKPTLLCHLKIFFFSGHIIMYYFSDSQVPEWFSSLFFLTMYWTRTQAEQLL